MARVYERPRYIHQARNRLLALSSATHNTDVKLSVAQALQCAPDVVDAMYEDYDLIARNALEEDIAQYDSIDLNSQVADFLLDSEIGNLAAERILSSEAAAYALSKDFLATAKQHKYASVLTDEQAVFYLISQAMLDEQVRVESDMSRKARQSAYELIKYQLLGQKIAPGSFSEVYGHTPMVNGVSHHTVNDEAWLSFAENLQYRSQPMWVKYCRLWASPPRRVRPYVQEMIDKVNSSPATERHCFDAWAVLGRAGKAYNYGGVIVLYTDDKLLVLDNSAADYLRVALTALRNGRLSFSMMRVSGSRERSDYLVDYNRCVRWVASAISDTSKAREVARHMHLAYTRWQNEAGEEGADIDCGWKDRVAPLTADMLQYHPHDLSWWNLVARLQCPERVKAEFLKLYHLLPPPDIDPLLLHNTLDERTKSANQCDMSKAAEFIKFCKAYDFCRFMTKYHKVPSYKADYEYDFLESKWVKSCLSGKLTLPPESSWGKVQIHKEFDYPHSGDFHVLDAKDSTRIVSNISKYVSRANSRSLERQDQNELLSALFNGSVLSNGMTMQAWRELVMKGGKVQPDECIAAEAGKAENTKPGKKVRETLSACDTMREYLTEVDHALRPLAELTPGVSIRVNLVKHKKKFQAMARSLSKRSTSYAFGTSTDVTGWSPMMDRNFFHLWQEYALSTTGCENPKAQVQLWDNLKIFVDRRGVKGAFECKTGNIQGWPATSDTTMHAHILIYWAYKLRQLKILSKNEAAYTLCLIDDAATVVALEGTVEQCKEKAFKAKQLLADLYLAFGFIMDDVKSFFSSIKFVYLNELYIDGAQVGHGTKTMMRIDKDHTRRFASMTDHIATAFGTAASASSQGADPFTAYWLASYLSYQWLFQKCPEFMDLGTVELFIMSMAPAGLNGLGIRPITSVFASGENDHLTWFIEICGQVLSLAGSENSRWIFSAFLNQELRHPDPISVLKTPFAVRAASNSSASASVASKFRDAAREKGLAEPFASLEQIDEDPEYELLVDKVLKSGMHDASLLEEVAANLPTALVDQMLARVEKTEIIAYLIGGRGIGDLRRRTQVADKYNLKVAYDMCTYPIAPSVDRLARYDANGSFSCAHELRDSMYMQTDYVVVNHTYPCPFSLWSFNGDVDLDSEQARRLTTVSFREASLYLTVGSETRNMYDSVADSLGYRGYMTARSDAAREIKVGLSDPVRRMVAAGLAAFRWAAQSGVHYVNLLRLFLTSWGGAADERLMMLPGRLFMGSSKRISIRHNKASHLVYPFQNIQACLRIDARSITTAQAQYSHMYDVMGAITTLRSAGLLEAALRFRRGVKEISYGFTYNEKSIAKIVQPSKPEKLLQIKEYSAIVSFCNISSEFQASARLCMSYDSMSKILAMAISAGEKAANALFSTMVENQELDREFATTHHQGIATMMELPVVQAPDKVAWASKPPSTRSSSTGAVQDVGGKSTRTVLSSMPRASLSDQVTAIGRQWLSSIVLDVANRDPVFATHLMTVTRRGSPADCINTPDWETKNHILRIPDPTLRAIIDETENLVPKHAILVHLNTVFAVMGATGFRAKAHDTTGDTLHRARSFFGTLGARLGLASAIGKGILSLRHNTPSGYSSVAVAPGRNTRRTLAKVIRAQWRTAAARRQIRADEAAARRAITPQITQQNYEASFLRLAAELLSNTGTMDMALLYSGLVTKAVTSISRHLGEGVKGEMFDDLMDASGLEFEVDSASMESAEMSIIEACRIAAEVDATVDQGAVLAAFKSVVGWVEQDIAGSHVISAPPSRRTNMSLPVRSLPPAIEVAPDTSALVVIGTMKVGESEEVSADSAEFHMLYQFVHKKHPEIHYKLTGHQGYNDAYRLLKVDADLRAQYRSEFAQTGDIYTEPEFSVFDVVHEDEEGSDTGFVQE